MRASRRALPDFFEKAVIASQDSATASALRAESLVWLRQWSREDLAGQLLAAGALATQPHAQVPYNLSEPQADWVASRGAVPVQRVNFSRATVDSTALSFLLVLTAELVRAQPRKRSKP
jgi:hypothetical protein